jgi:hypothetical protein
MTAFFTSPVGWSSNPRRTCSEQPTRADSRTNLLYKTWLAGKLS